MPSVVDSIGSLVYSIFGAITSVLQGIVGVFQNILGAIWGVFTTLLSTVGTAISGLAQTFEGLLKFLLSNIVIIGVVAGALFVYGVFLQRGGSVKGGAKKTA